MLYHPLKDTNKKEKSWKIYLKQQLYLSYYLQV